MALDGIALHGICVPSTSYLQNLLGYMTPASSVDGADTYSWWYYVSGSNMSQVVFKNGNFFQSNTLFPVPAPNCDTTSNYFDGMELGWGVGAAMVLAYAVHLLRRALT